MNSFALLVVALAILPAFGLAALGWLTRASETDEVRSFVGFEGMHVEKTGADRQQTFETSRYFAGSVSSPRNT